MIKPRRQV